MRELPTGPQFTLNLSKSPSIRSSHIQKKGVICVQEVAEQTESGNMDGPMTVKQRIRKLTEAILPISVHF